MTSRLKKAIDTVRTWTVTNWPTKLTALVLAAILWVAVAAQEPTTQLVPVRLDVQVPQDRALAAELPPVQALFAGRSRELIKLYARPPVVTKIVADTSGTRFTVELSTRDLQVDNDIDVSPQAIEPRLIQVLLDDVDQQTIPVLPRVSVTTDSGYAQFGSVTVEPESILIRGPQAQVTRTNAVSTQPLELSGLRAPVTRDLPLDTTALAGLRLEHTTVRVTVDVGPVSQTVLNGVPVRVISTRGGSWLSDPPAVIVTLRGRADRLNRMTADSVGVVAHITGAPAGPVTLTVTAPEGIAAQADPTEVTVRRRTP